MKTEEVERPCLLAKRQVSFVLSCKSYKQPSVESGVSRDLWSFGLIDNKPKTYSFRNNFAFRRLKSFDSVYDTALSKCKIKHLVFLYK